MTKIIIMKIISEKKQEHHKWHLASYNVIRDKKLSDGAVRLWIILWNWNNNSETSYPKIANILGVEKRKIIRNMNELKKYGYVIKHGDRNDTTFSVRFDTKTND